MSGANDAEDKVNMIPMIDTMLFLILFFMLVTKFTPDEKSITRLLPTDKGQSSGPSSKPVPTEQINIAIYPSGLQKGFQPSQYRDQMNAMIDNGSFNSAVYIRVGGADPIEIKGNPLSEHGMGSQLMKDQVNQLHAYIDKELSTREGGAAARKDQPPVIVSCFSGLSWKYALLAYDAVRAHEVKAAKGRINATNADLLDAREVTFAPPRIRNYNSNELGNELYEIVHLR
jgi:biopolymer transport protein ExbD